MTFVQTEEGRVFPYSTDTSNYYEYFLSDHLGNTTAVFSTPNGAAATATHYDDYLPFGMDIPYAMNNGRGIAANPINLYLYNKKELQENTQLYDYGARFYDPVVARFTTVDPLATKYPWYTPYQFAGNEVPNAIDRDGTEPAYPHADGSYTIARDGQLQRPLTDNDGISYINSKTELGGANHVWDSMTQGLNNTGTALQVVGYGLAIPTDGASLGLVAWGEGFDVASGVSSSAHDLSNGKTGDALITLGTTAASFGAGKGLEKLEEVGKLTKVDKTILSALTTTTAKLSDKGVETMKTDHERKTEVTPQPKSADNKHNEQSTKNAQDFFKKKDQSPQN